MTVYRRGDSDALEYYDETWNRIASRSIIQQVNRFQRGRKTGTGTCWLGARRTETEDLQLSRVMMQLGHKNANLDRHIYLINLLDHNETLFYRTLMSDPAQFLPIVYDPTIGEAVSSSATFTVKHLGCDFLQLKRHGSPT